MAKKILIAPSMRSIDWARLGEEIRALEAAGADMLHFDVGDGHFIHDIGVGADIIAKAKTLTKLPLEVHLMVDSPEKFVAPYATAGADMFLVHVESTPHLHRVLRMIREAGKGVGVTLNPGTPIESISEVLYMVDKISVMSVDAGVGGKFVSSVLPKIERLSQALARSKSKAYLQADGGVSLETRLVLEKAGITSFVVGYPIFSKKDYSAAIREIREGKPLTS